MAEQGLSVGFKPQRENLEARRRRSLALAGVPDEPESEGRRSENTSSLVDSALAIGGVGKTLATGAGAEVLAGVSGLQVLATGAIEAGLSSSFDMDDAVEDAARTVETVRTQFTSLPGTQRGQDLLQFAGQPFQKLFEFADEGGDQALENTGSVARATFQRSAGELAPALLGLRFPKATTKSARADIRSVDDLAGRTEIDLDAPPSLQRVQTQEAAERATGGQTVRAENLPEVHAKVQEQRQIARDNVDTLYEKARSSGGTVALEDALPFKGVAREALVEKFALTQADIDGMPKVKLRLKELDALDNLPGGSRVKLNGMEAWRKRVSTQRAPVNDLAQNAALGVLKKQYDNYMDTLFNADMISGNPAALQKWKDARSANTAYRERFRDDKVIRQLAEKEATPEEIKSWIFGASAVGAKKEAGRTVAKLKTILGEDSRQFAALRQETIFDIIDPLLGPDVDIKKFIKNYDGFVKKNPTLAHELFPDSTGPLADLRKLAPSVDKVDPLKIPFAWDKALSRALVGHEIAKAGLRVQITTRLMGILRSVGQAGKSRRKRIIAEVLQYDPFAPLLPKKVPFIGGATATVIDETEDDQ